MRVLFVCTGNICRSPMAEGIARARFSDLADFSSAGTMAIFGANPTEPARRAAAEIGVDIGDLKAQSVGQAADPLADRIYAMTTRHMNRIAGQHPELADRVELLDPAGDIPDPYGYGIDVYRQTRDRIVAALENRAAEWRTQPV